MASQKSGIVEVPASPNAVKSFVNDNRQRYIDSISTLKSLLDEKKLQDNRLLCIYKIYSRGENQFGDELKAIRKIRLKFNEFNTKASCNEASLFDVPDIVGLTIVVAFPSDISTVAAVIDAMIEDKTFEAVTLEKSEEGISITSKYGRAFEAEGHSKGYFACHYNVMLRGVGARPICEIQIKTLLHDAWGTKTHDLTYKSLGKIPSELLVSFDLLGSNLANLDLQSDALRKNISKNATVRETKRIVVQTCILDVLSLQAIESLKNERSRQKFSNLHATVGALDAKTPSALAEKVKSNLLDIYEENTLIASYLLCFLAGKVRHRTYFETAMETIHHREETAKTDLEKLSVRSKGALAAFAFGDVNEAIDIAEDTLTNTKFFLNSAKGDELQAAKKLALMLTSDLAYYHADIIGSYDGDKRRSKAKSLEYITESIKYYPTIGLPAKGFDASNTDIKNSIADPVIGRNTFFALDNEAFVKIQTCDCINELSKIRERLDTLHSNCPQGVEIPAKAAIDYHDYCARTRLAELEAERTD